jgi:hypothetical protein
MQGHLGGFPWLPMASHGFPIGIHGISMEYPWNQWMENDCDLGKSESDEPSKFDLIWGIWICLDKLLD